MIKMGNPSKGLTSQIKMPKKNFDLDHVDKITGHRRKNVLGVDRTKLGKDEFVKLLTHQMKNQDPLKPMDQHKFSAELAQFAQLEQLTNMNKNLQEVGSNKEAEGRFFAASFLGKNVTYPGSEVRFEGRPVELNFNLPTKADRLVYRITNEKGDLIQRKFVGNISRGANKIRWDGQTLNGGLAASGQYKMHIMAWDKENKPLTPKTNVTGNVSAVNFQNGKTILTVNGRTIDLRNVKSVELNSKR